MFHGEWRKLGRESVTKSIFDYKNISLRDPYSILLAHEAVHVLRQQNIFADALYFVRRRRIELLSQPWQGRVLPLNQHRISHNTNMITTSWKDELFEIWYILNFGRFLWLKVINRLSKTGDNPVSSVYNGHLIPTWTIGQILAFIPKKYCKITLF